MFQLSVRLDDWSGPDRGRHAPKSPGDRGRYHEPDYRLYGSGDLYPVRRRRGGHAAGILRRIRRWSGLHRFYRRNRWIGWRVPEDAGGREPPSSVGGNGREAPALCSSAGPASFQVRGEEDVRGVLGGAGTQWAEDLRRAPADSPPS